MAENKVQITIEAIDKAKAVLTDLAKDLKGVGDQGKTTGQSMSGLGGILASLKQSWMGVAIGVNQALEIFHKIGAAAAKIYNFVKEGQNVVLVGTAFKNMAASVGADADLMISKLVTLTKGVMDDTDLMKYATEAMLAGVKPDTITALTEEMKKLAPYAGATLPEGLAKLGTALEMGNARAIRSITGYIDLNYELEVYAGKLGTTADRLTDLARTQAIAEILLEKMRSKTVGLKETQELGINTFLRFESAWKNMIENMQKGVGPLAEMVGWFTKLIEKMNEYSTRQAAIEKDRESRKEFAKTPQAQAMLGAIGTTRGQGYEQAYQSWVWGKKLLEPEIETQAAARMAPATPGPPGIKPRSLQEQAQIKAYRLNEEVRILELGKFEEEAMKKRHEAELAGLEFEPEKRAAAEKRQAEELTQFKITQQEKIAEADAISWGKMFDDHLEILNEAALIEAEKRKANTAAEEKAMEDQAAAYGAAADQEQEDMEAGALAQLEAKKNQLIAETEAYREMYQTTGEMGQEYFEKNKELLQEGLDDWRRQGVGIATIEKIKIERLKALRIEAGIAGPTESIEAGLQKYEVSVANMAEKIRDVVTNVFKNLEDAIVEFATTGKLAFSDFANSVLKDMVRIMVHQQITGPLAGGIRSWLSGLSSGGGAGAQTTATIYEPQAGGYGYMHGGGIVPSERQHYHLVPRLHSGLSPDEYPAILQRGEGVFTPAQMKALGKTEVNISVINQSSAVRADVQESNNGRGSRDITVIVSEIAGGEASRFGSPLNRSLRQIGGRSPLIRR